MNYYDAFSVCFPDCTDRAGAFKGMIRNGGNKVITLEDAGFAVIDQNAILMLCVKPEYQHRGYGKQLLEICEQQIKGDITLGLGDSYVFQGVPVDDRHNENFFKKYGYTASWESVDMKMELKDFELDRLNIHAAPENVTFGYAKPGEEAALLKAVESIDEDWTQYFKGAEGVFCAYEDGKLAGCCLVDEGSGVGCVGVVPEARKKGIGLMMVAMATEELKKQGVKVGRIGYTGLESWYAKLGYEAYIRFWMGRKSRGGITE